jgi:prepilin-type N-terminal cleavage/methylation domain-containing protein
MGTGTLRTFPTGAGRCPQRGTTLLEMMVVMAIISILTALCFSAWDMGHTELTAAQHEIRGSLDQAFTLARAKGENVTVALGNTQATGHLPVQLGKHVKWGKPAHIPLPPGMDDPVHADDTGMAHATITVTPRRTATASLWFLNDGREALCMRINNHGQVQLLRWNLDRQQWRRV